MFEGEDRNIWRKGNKIKTPQDPSRIRIKNIKLTGGMINVGAPI